MLLVRRGLLANGVLAFGAMRRLAAWVCAIVLAGCGSSGSGAGGSGGASTVGLSSIKKVTLAVYGRSFATTTSGSVSWQTFKGIGASPSGGVANSTPYQWYSADATAYSRAGLNKKNPRYRGFNTLLGGDLSVSYWLHAL